MGDFSKYFVGAYATSPTLNNWDIEKEKCFMDSLKNSLGTIQGLELAFWGTLHEYDEESYLDMLDEKWEYVLTTLPGNMKMLGKNPHFGIASDNESSRLEAVEYYKKANEAVVKINTHFDSKRVLAVTIASAPSLKVIGINSSVNALKKSLKEIAKLDWQGAKLVIEHCDSGRVKDSVKGFLSLDEEIEAINQVNKECNIAIGITINWARSVLEHKDTKGVLKHLKQVFNAKLLSGLIFSGTSDNGRWSDLHLPINSSEPTSLLNIDQIKSCIDICDVDSLDYIGIKVLAMPMDEASLERRIAVNKDTLNALHLAIKGN
jgi:hypothetical protein